LPETKRNLTLTTNNSNSKLEKFDNQEINNKIDSLTNNYSKNYFKKVLYSLTQKSPTNAATICNYLMSEETEINIKQSTKEGKLKTLVWLSNYFEDKLTFRQMSKEDILTYLKKDKGNKSQRWIGTYNGRQILHKSSKPLDY